MDQLAYLAPPDSRERSTSEPPSRAAAEVGTPHTTTAAVSGSAGTPAAAPVGGTRPPAADIPRRRTGGRRYRTAGAAAVVAPRAGTRRRRTSPPSGPCRRHRASRRSWRAGAVRRLIGLGNWGRGGSENLHRRGGKQTRRAGDAQDFGEFCLALRFV